MRTAIVLVVIIAVVWIGMAVFYPHVIIDITNFFAHTF